MKNLVFDMGNVLIEWNSEKILQAITDDRKLHNLLRKEVFETGLWVQTDEGVKTREEMIEIVTTKIGEEYRNELTQLSRYWYKYVDVYTKVQDRIIELSKNGPTMMYQFQESSRFLKAWLPLTMECLPTTRI